MALFVIVHSQLQNTLFQHSHHHEPCIFTSNEQELHAILVKTCTDRGDPLLHNVSPLTVSLCYIHWLVSRDTQRQRMPTDAIFFCMGEFNGTLLFCVHFHARHHLVRPHLCCHLSHSNKWNVGGKVQSLLPSHQHLLLILSINIIKQEALLLEQPPYI